MAITWQESRGGFYAVIDPQKLFRLYVSWEGIERLPRDEPHWNVYVFGIRLKLRSESIEDAKRRAEKFATNAFREAIKAIED